MGHWNEQLVVWWIPVGSNISELVLKFSVAVLQSHKTKEPKEIFDIFSVVLQKGLLKTIDTP